MSHGFLCKVFEIQGMFYSYGTSQFVPASFWVIDSQALKASGNCIRRADLDFYFPLLF